MCADEDVDKKRDKHTIRALSLNTEELVYIILFLPLTKPIAVLITLTDSDFLLIVNECIIPFWLSLSCRYYGIFCSRRNLLVVPPSPSITIRITYYVHASVVPTPYFSRIRIQCGGTVRLTSSNRSQICFCGRDVRCTSVCESRKSSRKVPCPLLFRKSIAFSIYTVSEVLVK